MKKKKQPKTEEIGIRELKSRAPEVARAVKEERARYVVTQRGAGGGHHPDGRRPARKRRMMDGKGCWKSARGLQKIKRKKEKFSGNSFGDAQMRNVCHGGCQRLRQLGPRRGWSEQSSSFISQLKQEGVTLFSQPYSSLRWLLPSLENKKALKSVSRFFMNSGRFQNCRSLI